MAFFTLLTARWARRLVIFAVVFTIASLWQHWQPGRQAALHQQNLLKAVENKNLKRIRGFLADNYSDRFGHTRDTAMDDLGEVLQNFFVVAVRSQGTQTEFPDKTMAVITASFTISGNGTGAVEMISQEVNGLASPWVFFWRRQSWQPWDWKLEKADNASLNLPTGF